MATRGLGISLLLYLAGKPKEKGKPLFVQAPSDRSMLTSLGVTRDPGAPVDLSRGVASKPLS